MIFFILFFFILFFSPFFFCNRGRLFENSFVKSTLEMEVAVVAPKPIATAVVGNSASIAPAESITEPGSTAELPLSTAAAEIECEEGDGKTVSAKRAWTETRTRCSWRRWRSSAPSAGP